MKQAHWLLCKAKSCDWQIMPRSNLTQMASRIWNENLQQKQSGTAKSTNLKKMLETSGQLLPSGYPFELKSLKDALNITGVKIICSENLWSTLKAFDSSFE